MDPGRRCVYTCRIIEIRPDEEENLQVCDMTIVHDVTHPSYDPNMEKRYGHRRESAGSGMEETTEPETPVALETMDVDQMYGSTDDSLMESSYDMSMPSMGAELLQMLDMGGTEDHPPPRRPSASSQSSRCSSRSSSIDLSVLNPRTREMLGVVNLDHIEEPASDNDLNLSTNLVTRLNTAAANSQKSFTNYRNLMETSVNAEENQESQEVVMETEDPTHVIGQDSAQMFTVSMDGSQGISNFPVEEEQRGETSETDVVTSGYGSPGTDDSSGPVVPAVSGDTHAELPGQEAKEVCENDIMASQTSAADEVTMLTSLSQPETTAVGNAVMEHAAVTDGLPSTALISVQSGQCPEPHQDVAADASLSAVNEAIIINQTCPDENSASSHPDLKEVLTTSTTDVPAPLSYSSSPVTAPVTTSMTFVAPVTADVPSSVTSSPPVTTDVPSSVASTSPVTADVPSSVASTSPVTADVPSSVTSSPPVTADVPSSVASTSPVTADVPSSVPSSPPVTADVPSSVASTSPVTADGLSTTTSTNSVSPTQTSARTSPTNSISPEPGQEIVRLPDGRICVPVYGKDGQQIGLRMAHRRPKPKSIPKLKGSDFRGKIGRHGARRVPDGKDSLPGQLDGVDDQITSHMEEHSSSEESCWGKDLSDGAEHEGTSTNDVPRYETEIFRPGSVSPMWDGEELPGQLDGVDDINVRRTRSTRTQELDLRGKIDQQIKAQSLARSNTAREGPFKCPSCKRLYRTTESLKLHVGSCNFVVSSDEEEEDEDSDDSETAKPAPLKTYPLRSGRGGQEIVGEPRKSRGSPQTQPSRPTSALSQKLRGTSSSPATAKANHTPRAMESPKENNVSHDDSVELEVTLPVKRGRGRPRKYPLSDNTPSPSSTKTRSASPEPTEEVTMEEPKLTRSRARAESITVEEPKSLEEGKEEKVEEEPKLTRSRARAESVTDEPSPVRVLRRGRSTGSSPAPQTLQEIAVAHKSPVTSVSPLVPDKTQTTRKRGRPRKEPEAESCPAKTIALETPLLQTDSGHQRGTQEVVSEPHNPVVNGEMDTEGTEEVDVPQEMEEDTTMEEEKTEENPEGLDESETELNLTLEESSTKEEGPEEGVKKSDTTDVSLSQEHAADEDDKEGMQPEARESVPESVPTAQSIPVGVLEKTEPEDSHLVEPDSADMTTTLSEDAGDNVAATHSQEPYTGDSAAITSATEAPVKPPLQVEATGSETKILSVNPEKARASPTEVEVITIDDDDDDEEPSKPVPQSVVTEVRVKTSAAGSGAQLPAIIRRQRSAQELLQDSRVVRFEVTDPKQKAKFSKMNYEMVKLPSGKTVKMVRMSAKELSTNKALDDMPKFRDALKAAVLTSSATSQQRTPSSSSEAHHQSSPAVLQPASQVLKNIQTSMALQASMNPSPIATEAESLPSQTSAPPAMNAVVSNPPVAPVFAEHKSPPLPTRTVQFAHPQTKPIIIRALTQPTQPRILPKLPLAPDPAPLQPTLLPTPPPPSYLPTPMPVLSPGQQMLTGGLQLLQPQGSTSLVQTAQGSQSLLQGPQGSALLQGLPMQAGYVIPTGRQAIPQSSMMNSLLPNQTIVSMAPSAPSVIPMTPANQQPVFIQDPGSLTPNLLCSPTGLVSIQPSPCSATPPITTSPSLHLHDHTASKPALQSPVNYIDLTGTPTRGVGSLHGATGPSPSLVASSGSHVFNQGSSMVSQVVNKMDLGGSLLSAQNEALRTRVVSSVNPVMTMPSFQPAASATHVINVPSSQKTYIKSITPVNPAGVQPTSSAVISHHDPNSQAVLPSTHHPFDASHSVASVAVPSSQVTHSVQSSIVVSTLSGLALPSGTPISSVQFKAVPSVVTTPSVVTPQLSSQIMQPMNPAPVVGGLELDPLTPTSPSRTAAQHMSTSIVLAALSRLLREGVIRDPTVAAQLNVLINQYNKTQSLNHKQQEVLDKIEAILKAHLGGLAAKQVAKQVKAASSTASMSLSCLAGQPLTTSSYHSSSNQYLAQCLQTVPPMQPFATTSQNALLGQPHPQVGQVVPIVTPLAPSESLYFNAKQCKRKRADQGNLPGQKRRLLVMDKNNLPGNSGLPKTKLLPYGIKPPPTTGIIIRKLKPEKAAAIKYKKLLKQSWKRKTPHKSKSFSPMMLKGKRAERTAYSSRVLNLDVENQAPTDDPEWMPYGGRQHQKEKLKLLRQDEELPGEYVDRNYQSSKG